MNTSLAIRCQGLTKTYLAKPPVDAVRGLDLEVRRGECFGLLGPNGAGKTTTIEILEGLLEPSGGTVEVLGENWTRQSSRALRARLGVTLQETRLSEKATVEETIGLFASFYDKPLPSQTVLDQVELGEKRKSWVRHLSGGQKQRLAVACALIGDPELLFLDEPTTGLDPQSRRQMWEIVRHLRERGRTILITTHYMDEAERLCDRIAIVDHGKVIALGTPRELIASLGGDHVVEFTLETEMPAGLREELAKLPTVSAVRDEAGTEALTVAEPHRAIPALLELLRTRGAALGSLTTRHASLEDVFVALTGRSLREE